MGEKIDYKTHFKGIYLPKTEPVILDVPKMLYLMIEGTGDPNGDEFVKVTEALYSLTYKVKMSYKSMDAPEGYYEYTVFPLEGVWDLVDKSKPVSDKSNYKYTLMIRQPDFLTEELFHKFLDQTKKKKPNPYLDKLVLQELEEGMSCQMMHLGSYDDEPASFEKMEAFCVDKGYVRACKTHMEIYLSDPRRTEASKLKTVLRFSVKRAE